MLPQLCKLLSPSRHHNRIFKRPFHWFLKPAASGWRGYNRNSEFFGHEPIAVLHFLREWFLA